MIANPDTLRLILVCAGIILEQLPDVTILYQPWKWAICKAWEAALRALCANATLRPWPPLVSIPTGFTMNTNGYKKTVERALQLQLRTNYISLMAEMNYHGWNGGVTIWFTSMRRAQQALHQLQHAFESLQLPPPPPNAQADVHWHRVQDVEHFRRIESQAPSANKNKHWSKALLKSERSTSGGIRNALYAPHIQ